MMRVIFHNPESSVVEAERHPPFHAGEPEQRRTDLIIGAVDCAPDGGECGDGVQFLESSPVRGKIPAGQSPGNPFRRNGKRSKKTVSVFAFHKNQMPRVFPECHKTSEQRVRSADAPAVVVFDVRHNSG